MQRLYRVPTIELRGVYHPDLVLEGNSQLNKLPMALPDIPRWVEIGFVPVDQIIVFQSANET